MKLINKIKEKGFRRMLQVLYMYKIDMFFKKILQILFKGAPLLNVIVIESHNDFDNNGGAFYDYLISHQYNQKYKIIWLLKHPEEKNFELPSNVLCFPQYQPSLKKDYYQVRAKYFTADNDAFDKVRQDQITFYFTHGSFALKNIQGLDNIPHSTNYILSPSKNIDKLASKWYGVTYPSKSFVHLGFPVNDVLFSKQRGDLHKVTKEKYAKVILWMPTFRKGGGFGRNDSQVDQKFGVPLIDSEIQWKNLQAFLQKRNVLLIIKLHPKQDPKTFLMLKNTQNIIVLSGKTVKKLGVDNTRLFKNCDALVSDYSSAAYSFLLLNRPIAFVLSDLKEYKLGLIKNAEKYMCGEKLYNMLDLEKFIDNVFKGNDTYASDRERLLQWMYKYRDGDSSMRITEFLGLKI